jgi:acetyl-CoA carboxylase biotin carboxyl carrier protein
MSYFFNDDCKNLDTLKVLVELVSKNKLGKLEIQEGDLSVKIEGRPCPPPPPHHEPPMMPPRGDFPPPPPRGEFPPMPIMENPPMPTPQKSVQTVIETSVKTTTPTATGNVVKAPIVGTFYASPSPDKPPYVKVGDTVKKGDVIMIIESMKLMNEVQSDFDGVVKDIMVKDGSPVEFDQPIMVIE